MLYTAGKITITTALTGLFVFLTIFIFDIGRDHYQTVQAQNNTATTSLTVRNLPPVWVVEAFELTAAATNTPLNTGEEMQWAGTATNNMDYWLIICSNSATPTPSAAANFGDIGNPANAPSCDSSGFAWAVSGPTESGVQAVAATTTSEDAPFQEVNEWYGWVCDDDNEDPRCNPVFSQGDPGEDNASPFVLNFRPVLTSVSNDSPTLPGETTIWTSVSSDPDTVRGGDDIVLHVCATNFFDGECAAGQTIATTSPAVTENATASFEIPIPTQDFTYEAFVFLVDEFGHIALNNEQSDFEVANATPVILSSEITLNGGDNMTLTVPEGLTGTFTLDFTVASDNSCVALDGSGNDLAPGSEFDDVIVSVFRESVGTTTCDGSAGPFDANNCYTSGAAANWNYSCTPNVGTCTGNSDRTMTYSCEFSLWHIADPTDGTLSSEVQFPNEDWFAAVSVIDKLNATSTFTQSAEGVDVIRFTAFDLATAAIPYGSLEPGENTGTLSATTTVRATGNTGIDQELDGTSMCNPDQLDILAGNAGACPVSASSTIPVGEQQFAAAPLTAYGSGTALDFSSVFLQLGVPKSTATSTASDGDIYWGIAVPSTITLAGQYTGQNTFAAIASDATTW